MSKAERDIKMKELQLEQDIEDVMSRLIKQFMVDTGERVRYFHEDIDESGNFTIDMSYREIDNE